MPKYEVCLTVSGYYWTDVEAENEEDAEQYARDSFMLSETQHVELSDAEVKRYVGAE